MGVNASFVLLVASVPLCGPLGPEQATADPPTALVLPVDSESVDACIETPAAKVAPEPWGALTETHQKSRRKAQSKAARRPEEFWWTSSEDVLRGIYGTCEPRPCCKFCGHGKPCGNTCISKFYTCRQIDPCGCACQRPIGYGG